jgi:1-acyl-sn-glycerol-3-phosphate acyltransferase
MSWFDRFLRHFFFWVVVRPVVLLGVGLNVRHRERLPTRGPAIMVANHNSHLDTAVVMTLLPTHLLNRIHPVAAADYFLRNPVLAWFALRLIGIVPIERAHREPGVNPLERIHQALERGDIIIFFPEGTRGEPEKQGQFKSGIARLAEHFPEIPIVPLFMHGLGKTLPRGAWIPVPFFCDVFVGEPVAWCGDKDQYLALLKERVDVLAGEGTFPEWS